VLVESERGREYAGDLLDRELEDERIAPLDRSLATAIVYSTLRHRGTLDRLVAAFSDIPLEKMDAEMRWILRMAACQLLFLERIPDYAVLDEAATLAKRKRNNRAAGFATGVLRALQREIVRIEPDGPCLPAEPDPQNEKQWPWTVMDALQTRWPDLPHRVLLPIPGGRRAVFDRELWPDPEHDPVAALSWMMSHPGWLVKRWLGRFGAAAALSMMEAGNRHPEMSVRPNLLKCTREKLVSRLRAEKVEVEAERLRVSHTGPLWKLGSFQDGWFAVQDEAAQAVAPLVGVRPGELVADLCAAPGGKTVQLAETGARVLAADSERRKVREMARSFGRLGARAALFVADAGRPPLKPFLDAVLLDVPCSNTGVFSRRVEARWRLRERDIRTLARVQRRLLEEALAVVKRGGRVVYSTCSVEEDENGGLVREVVREGNGLRIEEELRIVPGARWTCGGYAARVRKS
jgi:16S rRNA (cytosine967-C5)-methyltransferase